MHAIRTHSSVAHIGMSSELPAVKRRLTTVLCADACGYAGQMQVDETGTLERLRRYRSIMGECFSHHEGRMVNTWGDAIIAEFASVVEAVRCAVEIQTAIGAENADLSPQRRMHFRIGINLGDVIEDGNDIYGEGVNAAARLESLAQPGGIMVSDTVYALTHKQLPLAFDFAGSRQVKGREAPVAGYRVRLTDARVASHTVNASAHSGRAGLIRCRSSLLLPAAAVGLLLCINLFAGIRELWVIYPAVPILALAVVRFLRCRK
ncbi:MAG: adenylate/guanylate cyclase domain-containing protein [Rhizobiaceae bacterium]|nr:adenylate/guanylate cyclase domain-containing protein [Rhizobiaceae bacterium]